MIEAIFGVDYYPEHWSEERWAIDADLMQQMGINTIRLAEFAWSKLELEAGVFDFSWLDRAIDVFVQRGIRVILGTPTAAPPAWLIQAHPEILPINEHGQQASFGQRRHYCPSQPAFHVATKRIVTAMAQHYREHPAVFAWQIDNEISVIINGKRCHCAACRTGFQQWLQQQYTSLEQLNQSWGTIFWSQEYTSWEQIPVPLSNAEGQERSEHNPGLYLDFARFTSENWIAYQHLQVEILREICPQHTLTHNLMGLMPYINYADLVRELDIVAWDNYPRLPGVWSQLNGTWDASRIALSHDLMRSLKKQPFWVMEQQAGPGGWGVLSPTPLPGELRLWTWQSVARGAAGIVYFRWRTSTIGTEQYWHGILPHHGIPGRRYQEIAQTSKELQLIGDLITAPVSAEVAILRSYESHWAFEEQPGAPKFSYSDQIASYYRSLWQRNINVDVITEQQALDDYKLLIAPCLFVLRDEVAARLSSWVHAGGTLVLTFRSGVKDVHSKIVDGYLPGALRELVGARVADYTALLERGIDGEPAGGPERLELTLGTTPPRRVGVDVWMDELELETQDTDVLGSYRGGMYDGSPAITLHPVGKGNVIYVGTSLDKAGMDLLMEHALHKAAVVSAIPTVPANVEIVQRVYEGIDYWFVLNHNSDAQSVTLPSNGIDLLTGKNVAGTILINGYDVLVVRSQA